MREHKLVPSGFEALPTRQLWLSPTPRTLMIVPSTPRTEVVFAPARNVALTMQHHGIDDGSNALPRCWNLRTHNHLHRIDERVCSVIGRAW
jgi:hypothetical protein